MSAARGLYRNIYVVSLARPCLANNVNVVLQAALLANPTMLEVLAEDVANLLDEFARRLEGEAAGRSDVGRKVLCVERQKVTHRRADRGFQDGGVFLFDDGKPSLNRNLSPQAEIMGL